MHSLVRIDPTNDNRREWFRRVSHLPTDVRTTLTVQSNRVYVPKTHPILEDERVQKRLGGQVFTSGKSILVYPEPN